MYLIFDLDDTLYPERAYVESGFRAVADDLARRCGWDATSSYEQMIATLDREGRGGVFDRLLERRGVWSRAQVKHCVDTYRRHTPTLALYPESAELLPELPGPIYLVTDGHKLVQQRKVDALGIERWFRKTYLTHRYGVRNAKPSMHCFELIRARERCDWSDLIYVGDNPAKDFVNLNRVGARTVRVLTGAHREVVARPGYDAQITIRSLSELSSILPGIRRCDRTPS
jgi:putative hydrolase of the HAD superfamily